ncbi:monodechloroaminopyrrolnitrin synthase PrnB family protein [Streptomyces sp. NPDC058701]|uniref:monodechloroaminopyrrolnitrin synthase PrnB family protein n=1 Tax=Streptomyces sp. NPDC058701 TaxID=3346608 RepID=UPI003651C794
MSAQLVVGRAFTGGAVAAADPLAFDPHVLSLSRLNQARDTDGLLRLLASICPRPQDVAAFSTAECAAAMRDLGMLLGSLRRHAVEPVRALPGTLPVLHLLGERTGMVPRDTIVHYTVWNPHGPRERTHTDSQEESAMLAALRWYTCATAEAAGGGAELAALAIEDDSFPDTADRVTAALREATVAVDAFALDVPPAFFADVLRPYYEPVAVGAQSYPGPSPAHGPLPALDRLLWACDVGIMSADDQWSMAATYAVPSWRP